MTRPEISKVQAEIEATKTKIEKHKTDYSKCEDKNQLDIIHNVLVADTAHRDFLADLLQGSTNE